MFAYASLLSKTLIFKKFPFFFQPKISLWQKIAPKISFKIVHYFSYNNKRKITLPQDFNLKSSGRIFPTTFRGLSPSLQQIFVAPLIKVSRLSPLHQQKLIYLDISFLLTYRTIFQFQFSDLFYLSFSPISAFLINTPMLTFIHTFVNTYIFKFIRTIIQTDIRKYTSYRVHLTNFHSENGPLSYSHHPISKFISE